MIKLSGMGVYGAIAIGEVKIIEKHSAGVEYIKAADAVLEKQRAADARALAIAQLEQLYSKALAEVGEAEAQIFEVHRMMLEDDELFDAIIQKIEGESASCEYAIAEVAKEFAAVFSAMEDEYMRERAADVKDIAGRLSKCLTGEGQIEDGDAVLEHGSIICAEDLTPSETLLLDKSKVLAFVTAYGSTNSHTAILARSMNIPAIIGLGKEFLGSVRNGVTAIVDGYTGELYIDPDVETAYELKKKQAADLKNKSELYNLRGKENVTKDGRTVKIFANVGNVGNIPEVLENDAGGIGLFRSEFLYLESSNYPTEEMQFNAYSTVLNGMRGKQVIIRTLDIGADKQADYFEIPPEENPALGFRAIRICLDRVDVFKTQLRALYRASVHGTLAIMFPMIISRWEVERCLEICEEVRAELTAQGHSIADNIQHGIMVETPAAAMVSDELAPLVDFFSVGTNDLTQYTLACDRQNPLLGKYSDQHHEAVLRLIELAANNAHKHGKWIGICGELAADTTLTERFMRMGIDELSVSPPFILPLRDAVRKLDLSR